MVKGTKSSLNFSRSKAWRSSRAVSERAEIKLKGVWVGVKSATLSALL